MNGSSENQTPASNPWKIGAIATVAALLILVAAGFTLAAFRDSAPAAPETASDAAAAAGAPQQAAAPAPPAAPVAAAPPPAAARPREDCSRYLAGSGRDTTTVAKKGAVGAIIGAGTGAAGGAIADGGSGAGKGAGIGAVVGAVAGTLHGLNEDNERIGASERAYHECLARNN